MNNLLDFFKNEEEFIRLKELNEYFKKNEALYIKISRMNELQKEIVHARYKENSNVKELNLEYSKLINDIIDIPFVEEYFELLNLFYNTLEIVKENFEFSLI